MDTPIIGFVGAGNMAGSLIRGLLATGVPASSLLASDVDSDKLQNLQRQCGIQPLATDELAARADVMVLAVKPQVMRPVCEQIRLDSGAQAPLMVSVAAGISIASIERWLGGNAAIVRCMPNTPALIGRGATVLCCNDRVTPGQRSSAEQILAAVGLALWVDEEALLDSVTAVSGSGPAYFFLLMEAMQQAARDMGLDETLARQLVCQTALGAAELAGTSEVGIEQLRAQVTSPGGTTAAAISTFEQGDFRRLVKQALAAARDRSRELSREFGGN